MWSRKRCIAITLSFLLMLTCFNIPVSATETVFAPEITVDNNTRLVQIEGKAVQAPGTRVTIAVWYPDKSVENLLAGEDISEVNAYTQEIALNSESEYSHSFYLTPDAISGIYTLNINIPGYDEPQTSTFIYRNLTGARLVLNTAKTGTASEILSSFNNGLVHVNVETSIEYEKYKSADRGYIASRVEKERPVGDEDEGFNSLASIVDNIMEQITKTRELATANRTTVRDAVLNDSDTYLINAEDIEKYNDLSKTKKEKVIAELKSSISDALYPEDVRDAFEEAVEEAANSKTQSGNSAPGGSGGSGGSGVSSSVKFGSELMTNSASEKLEAVDSFTDLSDCEWAKDEINTLAGKGIINGKGDGKFCPNDNITREELIKLLITAFGVRAASASAVPFKDVEYGAWYYDSIATAYQLRMVSGMSAESFGIGLNVTRQDMVVMLYNVLYQQGITMEPEIEKVNFADSDEIATYATRAVDAMSAAKVVNGQSDNRFAPKSSATRAEAVKIIYEVMYRLNLL